LDSGTDINQIPSSVSHQHGGNPRVSTTECEDGLRVRWSCLRYVHLDEEECLRKSHPAWGRYGKKDEKQVLTANAQIGFGSNRKTRHMMPSGHKAFLVHNPKDVDLLLMHNRTYAAEIAHAVSSKKRIEIIAKAKSLGVKVTNPKARVTTES
jgi:ribosomal protein L32E